jgi:hypothetical protein
MNIGTIGIAAIIVCVLCLVASFFGAPPVTNLVGLAAGVVGLIMLGRAKKSGGA